MDFLSAPGSLGYIASPRARARVHYICGGVVRSLLDAKRLVGVCGSDPKGLDLVETDMRERMMRSCEAWMKEVRPAILKRASAAIADLMRGSATWRALKPAYDQGLVALAPKGTSAVPVSSVAASVLHQALARHLMKNLVPLDSIDNGGARGIVLERQVHVVLDGRTIENVPTRSLDGSPVSKAVTLRSDYALPFYTAAEAVCAETTSVLYLPKSNTYPCDAIMVPPQDAPDAPVVLVEVSVTSPTDSKRLDKLLRWFRPAPPPKSPLSRPLVLTGREKAPEEGGGFIELVRSTHPGRRVIVVLCWLGKFEGSDATGGSVGSSSSASSGISDGGGKKHEAIKAANEAGISVCVVDTHGLELMGVRVKA